MTFKLFGSAKKDTAGKKEPIMQGYLIFTLTKQLKEPQKPKLFYAVYDGAKIKCYQTREQYLKGDKVFIRFETTNCTLILDATAPDYASLLLSNGDHLKFEAESIQALNLWIGAFGSAKHQEKPKVLAPSKTELPHCHNCPPLPDREITQNEINVLIWCQEMTKLPVENFSSSWQDGRVLVALVEALRPGVLTVPLSATWYCRVCEALEIAQLSYSLENTAYSREFVNGDAKYIYPFVKQLYEAVQKEKEECEKQKRYDTLLCWSRALSRTSDIFVEINDFSSSWKSGKAMMMLLNSLRPEIFCVKDHYSTEDQEDELLTAKNLFKFEDDLSVQDFINGDEKKIMDFVHKLHLARPRAEVRIMNKVESQKPAPEKEQENLHRKDHENVEIADEALVYAADDLLQWCRSQTEKYEHVDIQNFDKSWQSGEVLLALLNSMRPDDFPVSKHPSIVTVQNALDLAVNVFEIKGDFSLGDFSTLNSDKIIEFVSQLRDYQQRNKAFYPNPENEKVAQVRSMEASEQSKDPLSHLSEEEKSVLTWCQKKLEPYEHIKVEDFKDSWRSGLALNMLIFAMRPEFIIVEALDAQEPWERIRDGLDIAEQVFGAKLDIGDMEHPNEAKITRFVTGLYNWHQAMFGDVDEEFLTDDNDSLPESERTNEVECPPGKMRCKNCPALQDSNDRKQWFRCTDSDCKAIFCRRCKIDFFYHEGKSCEEATAYQKQQKNLEEELTMAVIRKCHKCGVRFAKDEGCNNMACRCGATQCYLCREPNIEYNHFCSHERSRLDDSCKENCGRRCLLYSDQAEFDDASIRKIKERNGVLTTQRF